MSKEEYLKGEEKEEVLRKIRHYIGFRMYDKEILNNLKTDGVQISERTLRRYKQEIQEKMGSNAAEIFRNQVLGNLDEDICSYEAMQREAWKAYAHARTFNEQIRALSIVRNATSDKIKLLNNIPRNSRHTKIDTKDVLKKTQKEITETVGWFKNQSKPKIHS